MRLAWLIDRLRHCGRRCDAARRVPVPETIRAEGVPPVPASVRQALNRYQNIRSASFQDWASDGSGMYVMTRFADVPQVHFVAKAGGARTQLTFLDERVLSVSARPRHDQFLYVGRRRSRELPALPPGPQGRRGRGGSPTARAATWRRTGRRRATCWPGAATPATAATWTSTSPPRRPAFRPPVQGGLRASGPSPTGRPTKPGSSPSSTSRSTSPTSTSSKSRPARPRRSPRGRADPKAEPVFIGERRGGRRTGESLYYLTDQGSEFRRLVHHDLASGNDRDRSRPTSRGTSRSST